MAIFVVLSPIPKNQGLLKVAVERAYPDSNMALAEGNWLIADSGDAKKVSDTLGVTNNDEAPINSTLVVEVASYYGRHAPTVWSWIKEHWEATASG